MWIQSKINPKLVVWIEDKWNFNSNIWRPYNG